MKKRSLNIIFLLVISAFLLMSFKKVNTKSMVSIKPGWLQQQTKKQSCEKSFDTNMWQVEGQYKYQKPKMPYVSLILNYSQGKKSTSDRNYKLSNINAEIALGETFGFAKNYGMISPFLAVGYRYMQEDGSDNKEQNGYYYGYKSWFYGIYGLLGIDLQYLFSPSISAGLVAGAGLHINPTIKCKKRQKMAQTGNTTYMPTDKYSVKQQVFFKARLPLKYHIYNYAIGLEPFYTYIPIDAKADCCISSKKIHQLGVAFLIVAYF